MNEFSSSTYHQNFYTPVKDPPDTDNQKRVDPNEQSNAGPSRTPSIKQRNTRLRSTGCKTCRQRKIKCDELKPSCRNCAKSHRTCLGYTNLDAYVFKDETDRVETRLTQPKSPENSYSSGFAGSVDQSRRGSQLSLYSDDPRQSSFMPSGDLMLDNNDLLKYYNSSVAVLGNFELQPTIDLPSQATAFQLETFFYHRFIDSVWLHSQADAWKEHLPAVLHKSPSLYYSVMSLSALFMAKTGKNAQAKDLALSLYQATLGHLQTALFDTSAAFEDTTLMATVIIGFYELIDKPGHESWASHSRGTAELMKMRGQQFLHTGIGKMLFRTFRGFEVLRAILQFDRTFVADEAWTVACANPQTILASKGLLQNSSANSSPTSSHASNNEAPDYAAVLFMLGGQAANLQADCVQQSSQGELSRDQSSALVDRATRIEQKLYTWRTSLPAIYNTTQAIPATTPTAIHHTSSQSPNPFTIGYQLCFYSAFLLLVHRTVAKYIHRDLARVPASDQVLARTILQTADLLTRGQTTMSLNITWPVYMSSISLTHESERQWAMDVLRVICAEKGWSVANSALSAAAEVARRSKLRAEQRGTT